MKEQSKPSKTKRRELPPEDTSQWSYKRIAIFLIVLIFMAVTVILLFRLRTAPDSTPQAVKGASDAPQIKIPEQDEIVEILDNAQTNIADIDVNDVVSSQPQIQNAIKELQKLTQERSVKETVCSMVCGGKEDRQSE